MNQMQPRYSTVTTVHGVTIDIAHLESWRERYLSRVHTAIAEGDMSYAHRIVREILAMVSSPGGLKGHESFIEETHTIASWMVRAAYVARAKN